MGDRLRTIILLFLAFASPLWAEESSKIPASAEIVLRSQFEEIGDIKILKIRPKEQTFEILAKICESNIKIKADFKGQILESDWHSIGVQLLPKSISAELDRQLKEGNLIAQSNTSVYWYRKYTSSSIVYKASLEAFAKPKTDLDISGLSIDSPIVPERIRVEIKVARVPAQEPVKPPEDPNEPKP